MRRAPIVHPPGWAHAAAVRRLWPHTIVDGLTLDLVLDWPPAVIAAMRAAEPVVTLRRHSVVCRRCDRDRHVWSPLGHAPRRCDFGACPQCDRWRAPAKQLVVLIEGADFDTDALRCGEPVPWHELSDASIMEVTRYETKRLSDRYACAFAMTGKPPQFNAEARRDLGFALAEAAFRGLLPTPDELRIAWDLAQARGWAQPDDHQQLTLVDVWALFVPRLRALV